MKRLNGNKVSRLFWLALLCAALSLGPPGAARAESLPGDVNGDGAIDILDVQSSVNMALGASTPQAEADVDLNAAVDVLDVQNLTNTVLGVGGLVQRVEGQLETAGGGITVVAVSEDGRMVQAPAEPGGGFELTLPVRTAWSMGFLSGQEGSQQTAGTVLFPVATGASVSLPLPNLSPGNVLDLGAMTLGAAAPAEADVRELISHTAEPIRFEDLNGNGAPDIVEEWLLPLDLGDAAVLGLSVDEADVIQFLAALSGCAESQGLETYAPDLGAFRNGLPVALQPMLACLPAVLEQWIREQVNIQPWMEPLLKQVVSALAKEINDQLKEWFRETDIPELQDGNSNRVPDFIEPDLCLAGEPIAGVSGQCELDGNGDGAPDFTEDANANGTPDIADTEHPEDDIDGDGIANPADVDDDNDGKPDYADV